MTRRFLHLLRFALLLTGVWLVAGLFGTSNVYRNAIVLGGFVEAFEIFCVQMSTALVWALITPLLIFIGTRLPIRKPHRVRNSVLVLLMLPPLAIFRAVLGSMALNLGQHQAISVPLIRHSIAIRFHGNVFTLAMIFLIINVIVAQREAAERERSAVAKRTLLARAEIEELRAQLQPHFLFTTLRTIARVLHDQPAKADAMIVHLSDLLRETLSLRQDDISLGEELDFVDRYLELYRDAFDGRLIVTLSADDDVLDARVPPLLLQPVVESMVVNGIEPNGGGTIAIRADREEAMLRLEATARGVDELALTRQRLGKLFGEQAILDIQADVELSRVTMRIPLVWRSGEMARPA